MLKSADEPQTPASKASAAPTLRPIDLARPYGLSSQAIRTYEDRGILPPADRSEGGHRRYGAHHRAALAAFRALAPAIGYAASADVVGCAHRGEVDRALLLLDEAHRSLAEDRTALDLVAVAIGDVRLDAVPRDGAEEPLAIGQVARRIGVTAATIRAWERAGILRPVRARAGHRLYRAEDVRDAHLARQLRHGGHGLAQIATILAEVRDHRSHEALSRALEDWRAALRSRGLALLEGAASLHGLIAAGKPEPARRPPG